MSLAKGAIGLLGGWLALVALMVPLPQTASLVRYPYLQDTSRTHATVLWATAEAGVGAIELSTDRSFNRRVVAERKSFPSSQTGIPDQFQYQAVVNDLRPDSEYFYRVLMDGQVLLADPELRFRTAPETGAFTFLAFGDSGQGRPAQSVIAQRMASETTARMVVHSGDIAYPVGSFIDFQERHFAFYRELFRRVPSFPAPGNHEYYTPGAIPFLSWHSVPAGRVPLADRGLYYSFDWSNVHFIVLDSNDALERAARGETRMVEWLEEDLRSTSKFWRIAVFHHPPYSRGPNQDDPLSELVRRHVVPILERYDVSLVLNGHEHSYQRTHPLRRGETSATGVVYVVTGGGGADLYAVQSAPFLAKTESRYHYLRIDVSDSRATVKAIDLNGAEFDSYTLAPLPVLTASSVVNGASFASRLAPGSLISVFGQFLSPSEAQASSLPLPSALGQTTLTLNGAPLPLLYTARGQINAQLPFEASGTMTLRVQSPNGSAQMNVAVSPTSPGIFFSGDGRTAAIQHADGRAVGDNNPATPGEIIQVFLTGLGRVRGTLAAGQAAPTSQLLVTEAEVRGTIGGIAVEPSFAGLAPGFVGLYQVNLRIPSGLASGSHALRIDAGGISSNPATIAVRVPGVTP